MTRKELVEFIKEYTSVDDKEERAITPKDVKDPQLRDEIEQWIISLESGEYQQAPEALYGNSNDVGEVGYCCLGVACYVSGFDHETLDHGHPSDIEIEPKNKLTQWLMHPREDNDSFYSKEFERLLIHLNDETEAGFDVIAKILRAKYKIYE